MCNDLTAEGAGPSTGFLGDKRLSESAVSQSLNLNASIRDRLRSKVRGRQVRDASWNLLILNFSNLLHLSEVL